MQRHTPPAAVLRPRCADCARTGVTTEHADGADVLSCMVVRTEISARLHLHKVLLGEQHRSWLSSSFSAACDRSLGFLLMRGTIVTSG